MHSKLLSRTCILISGLCLLSIAVHAQNEDQAVRKAIREELEIQYSNKVKTVLEKDKNRIERMSSESKAIEKQKDPVARKQAIDKYVKDHKAHYLNAMKDAGINLPSLLNSFKSRYPDYNFSSPDGISLIIEKDSEYLAPETGNSAQSHDVPSSESLDKPSGPSMNVPEFISSYPMSFTTDKLIDCGGVAGASVSFTSRSVTATATAIAVGGCAADGYLLNETTLPSNPASLKLKLNFSYQIQGYAVGVVASAVVDGFYNVNVKDLSTNTTVYDKYTHKEAFAAFLWVASMDYSASYTNTIDILSRKGKKLKTSASSSTFAIAGLSPSTSGTTKVYLSTAAYEY